MIKINNNDYTIEEIEKVFNLAAELLKVNEEQNAKLIAMNAKLENEEKKVNQLKMQLFLLAQNTIN